MKKTLLFTANDCVELKDPKDIDQFKSRPDAIINAEVGPLYRVPKKYWKLDAGRVVEMSLHEKTARDAHLAKYGLVGPVFLKPKTKYSVPLKYQLPLASLSSFLLGLLLGKLLF